MNRRKSGSPRVLQLLGVLSIAAIFGMGCSDTGPIAFTENSDSKVVIPADLVSPAHRAVGLETGLVLEWEDPADEGGVYTVYLDTVNPPQKTIAQSIVDTFHVVSGLKNKTTYYWYVVTDEDGHIGKSEIFRFTTRFNVERTFELGITDAVAIAHDGAPFVSMTGFGLLFLESGGMWYPFTGDFWGTKTCEGDNCGDILAQIVTIHFDTKGVLWLGTKDYGFSKATVIKDSVESSDGSGYVDVYTLQVTSFQSALKSALKDARTVRDLQDDQHGNMWIATNMGVVRRTNDGKLVAFSSTLPSKMVNAVLIDSAKNAQDESEGIWAGTDGGAALLSLKRNISSVTRVDSVRTEIDSVQQADPGSLVDTTFLLDSIMAIDTIVANSFTYLNPDDSTLQTVITMDTLFEFLRFDTVETYFWQIDTTTITEVDTTIDTIWTVSSSMDNLPDKRVSCMEMSSDGSIWAGTYSGGVIKFDGTEWTEMTLVNTQIGTGVINCLLIDASGDIWAGTEGGGIVRFAPDGGSSRIYISETSSLPSNYVRDLAIDSSGKIWAATTNGVISFTE